MGDCETAHSSPMRSTTFALSPTIAGHSPDAGGATPDRAAAPAALLPHEADVLALLDETQEWSAFSRRTNQAADAWESSVVIEGMHCAACSLTVEDALSRVPGVISVQVGAASHRARVVWRDTQVLPSAWMQAVQDCGYRAVPANDVFASERRKLETRKALWRWLVAGLCMMQVMMYAYPAYIAHAGDLTAEMEQLLRWASWVLTLPVMLFSCGPFFRNAWRDLAHLRVNMDLPVAIGILITFAVSTAGTFEPLGQFGHEVYFDSLTMFVFFLLTGRWLELRLRDRTAGALEAVMNRLPDSVERRQSDGAFVRVAARRVMVGDVLRVQPGETFMADGVLCEGQTQVDESLLTGESRALPRGVGAPVLSGSHNVGSTVQMRVEHMGAATRFAQIVALMESAAATKSQGAVLADRLAKPFLIAVLIAAAAACAWWWGRDPEHALMVAVAVLVVTCPCALSLATPAAMLASAGAMARGGVLVRQLQALEALAGIDTLVFDKTGTLTRDSMVLASVETRVGCSAQTALEMAVALAQHSHHPVSRALASAQKVTAWRCYSVHETAGKGVAGVVYNMGAQGDVGAVSLRLGSDTFCAVPSVATSDVMVYLSDDQGWLASFRLQEELRAQAASVVAALTEHGVDVCLLSGDRAPSVARVAQQLGIQRFVAACSPDDKLHYLHGLQAQGHRVAMVGDGLNDGPILAGANVSFAFGQAVALAQAKADFVVLGEHLMRVVDTLVLARRTMAIVRQNLWWALAYNTACVPLAVFGVLPAWLAGLGMASSSLVVVLNALRLAPALATEKVS